MKLPALIVFTTTVSACVSGGPVPVCTTISSERISPRQPLVELDGASLNDWFADVEPDLTWNIRWIDISGAPAEDILDLTLERNGRAVAEEVRPSRPETPDTPDSLRDRCLDGPYVRTGVRVRAQTQSGAIGTSEGELMLLGPDLDEAVLTLDIQLSGPDWLTPVDQGAVCGGDPVATLVIDADHTLDSPMGSVSILQNNCRSAWGEWTSAP